MLSPASLGICCLAVMAPALTKAVNQAEDFNLPLFYKHSDISIQEFPSAINQNNISPFSDFRSIKEPKKPYDFTFGDYYFETDLLHYSRKTNYHQWLVDVLQLAVYELLFPCDLVLKAACKTYTLWCNVWLQRRVGVQCPTKLIRFCWCTMSKDIPISQDRMGLLNANTSLDCEFKPKISFERQSAWPSDFSVSTKDFEIIETMSPNKIACEVVKKYDACEDCADECLQENVCYSEMEEARKKHVSYEQRLANLMTRLGDLQVKLSEVHVVRQLKAFVEHQQKSLNVSCQRQQRPNSYRKNKDSDELKAELLQSENVKNLSTAALVSLVKSIESSHASGKLLHSQKSNSSISDNQMNDKVLVKLNLPECTEIDRASGTLLNSLQHVECMIDSDVTESSSGGESCDEFDGYEEKTVLQTPPIHKRALWKWAADRAAVASRWTWLQAQVSDLEYRIRQQNEIYKQLRSAKGDVSLLPNHTVTETSSNPISVESVNCQNSTFNQVAAKCPPKTVNGFLDRGSVATSNGYHTVRNVPPTPEECLDLQLKQQQLLSADDSSCQSSRTLPLKSSFRKRRLLQTAGLHLISRRAARLSTVKCSCNYQSDVMSCALCGGRYNNIQSVDPDMMPLLERIALLDPSFHPVLSFEQDVPLPLHFETLLKKSEQYHFASRAGSTIHKKPRLSVNPKDFRDSVRTYSRKLTRNAAQALLSSAKYRKKHGGRKPGQRHYRKRGSFVGRWRRLSHDRTIGLTHHERRRRFSDGSTGSSKPSSPTPPPSLEDGNYFCSLQGRSGNIHEYIRKRRGDNAFDINNIIIPYSIASATRVEKLQYKEILTPKWRIVENLSNLSGDENGPLKSDDEMEEDISDEMIFKRHQRCEEAERKHLTGHLHLQNARGRCRGSRFDSRADSSGANTPDPLSPYQQDIMFQDSNSMMMGGPGSPALSPPATPLSAVLSDDSQPSGSSMPGQRSERKRTVSFTNRDRPNEEPSFFRAPEREYVYAPPYEPRMFPLLDEEYEEMLKDSPHLEILRLPSSKDPSSPEESTSTASSVPDEEEDEEEDAADPEWTVISKEKDGGNQALVLKLAKR